MTGNGSGGEKVYMTLAGLALLVRLDWPFHPSSSGADFWTLHAEIRPVGAELHALVAVNLSVTVREILPSLESKDTEIPVLNALRKEFDRMQIEFLKSAKLVPLPFSSRHYDFKRNQWTFHQATDAQVADFLLRKVYWQTKATGTAAVPMNDAADAQYLGRTPEQLVEVAKTLSGIRVEGNSARPTDALLAQAEGFETAQRLALEKQQEKHAFERG